MAGATWAASSSERRETSMSGCLIINETMLLLRHRRVQRPCQQFDSERLTRFDSQQHLR